MRRGLGWLPDPPKFVAGKPKDWCAAAVIAQEAPPERWDNRDLIVSILDQGQLPTCVANVIAQAIRVCHVKHSATPVLCSRLFAHYLARSAMGERSSLGGTNYRTMFDALNKLGVPPEIFWPYDDRIDGDRPKWRLSPSTEAIKQAFDQKQPLTYRRIYDTGEARLLALRRAISQRNVVAFGAQVTEAFCNNAYHGDIVPSPSARDTIAGGHALLLAEYDGVSFGGPNSWGRTFGNDGWFRFSPEYLVSEFASDFWIIEKAVTL